MASGPLRARATSEPRASQAASPGRPMLATITSAKARPRIGERIAQPRRSSTRPVNRSVLVADAQAAKALRATTSVRIQVRAGAHASGSRAATARSTTPASPMIEYPTMCSMSSWIHAAIGASRIDATAIATTTARAESRSTSSGAMEASVQASATMAKAPEPMAVTSGRAVSGTASVRRADQAWNGMAPNRIATARAIAR